MTLNPDESAFVCIQPGTENIPFSTFDAEAIQIGCCCECESYSITGNTTYGTTLYNVRYCGSDTTELPITISAGTVTQICVNANYFFLALVDSPGPLLILPDVESLGCCVGPDTCSEWYWETITNGSNIFYTNCLGQNITFFANFPGSGELCVLDGTTPTYQTPGFNILDNTYVSC